MSDMGRFGITGADMEDGDELVLSGNFMAPLVLRPTIVDNPGFDGEEPQFRMVGFAYVDGVMDNDCLDAELVMEILGQQSQAFSIY